MQQNKSAAVSRVGLRVLAGALAVGGVLAAAPAAEAANFFFSFQTTQNGSGGAYTADVTAEDFPGTPTLTTVGGGAQTGGETSFTAYNGTTWLGSGSNASPGHSLAFPTGTDRTFTLHFSMEDLQDLTLRMAIRSAGPGAPNIFSNVEYSLNGTTYTSFGLDAAERGFTAGSTFVVKTFDFSSFDAIEDQPTVSIRWTIAEVPVNASVRIDNIEATASPIPEPAALGLLSLSGLALIRRRR